MDSGVDGGGCDVQLRPSNGKHVLDERSALRGAELRDDLCVVNGVRGVASSAS